ncbi:hypothetical protein OB03_09980 [Brevundimonas sp. GN22]
MRLISLAPLVALPLLVLGACAPQEKDEPQMIGMPNPASVHCKESGGRSEIRTQSDGGQYGVCVFNDGRQCEEWALFRDNRCVAPTQR